MPFNSLFSHADVKNVEFHCGKAEEVLPNLLKRFTKERVIAIVDPPRAGLRKMPQRPFFFYKRISSLKVSSFRFQGHSGAKTTGKPGESHLRLLLARAGHGKFCRVSWWKGYRLNSTAKFIYYSQLLPLFKALPEPHQKTTQTTHSCRYGPLQSTCFLILASASSYSISSAIQTNSWKISFSEFKALSWLKRELWRAKHKLCVVWTWILKLLEIE